MAGERTERDAVSTNVQRALQKEDSAAVSFLARRACRLALRTASAIVSTRGQADDIAQEVAIDALRSLPRLRDPAAFDAWVHRIAVRHVGRAIRREKRSRSAEVPLAMLSASAEPEEDGRHEEQLAMRGALVVALTSLPEKQRLAIALRYIHDLSDRDIAEALECREGNVRALLSRARTALHTHEQLAGFIPTPSGGAQ